MAGSGPTLIGMPFTLYIFKRDFRIRAKQESTLSLETSHSQGLEGAQGLRADEVG